MRQFYKTYHFLFDRLSIPAKFREHGELPDTRRFMSCENS